MRSSSTRTTSVAASSSAASRTQLAIKSISCTVSDVAHMARFALAVAAVFLLVPHAAYSSYADVDTSVDTSGDTSVESSEDSLTNASNEQSTQNANGRYPKGPHLSMTPGSLCTNPDTYRYPEKIAYCSRDVSSELKRDLIRRYDEEFGYRIQSMRREAFKIDHFIPLCAGGSNNPDNLWPQHESVYSITDPMEPLVCGKMAQGKLRQEEAVKLIREGKTNLSRVPEIIDQLNAL